MKRFSLRRPALGAIALLLPALLLGAAQTPPAVAAHSVDELRAQVEALVTQPRFNGALWGAKIVSLDTDVTLFEHHADRLLSPASNTKLYTAALALDQLGSDYRIVTLIFGTAKPDAAGELRGDLIVSGRGDPSWKTRGEKKDFWEKFEPFVAALTKAGVRHIAGDIVADATWFRSLPNGAGWTADDLNDYYGAEISALTLDDNYAQVRITPAAKAGEPCAFLPVQPHTGLVFDNRTVTAAAGTAAHIEAQRIVGENTVHVFGELPLGGTAEIVDVTVPRPANWFASALKEALVRRGLRVDGNARSLRWPEPSPVGPADVKLGEISSPPLRELVVAMMKASQNLEADLLFAHLGETQRAPDAPPRQTSEESAVVALKNFLRKNGLPADDVRFEEGSGLSRNNLTTANATVALLRFMAAHRNAKDFFDSLPIAGVDGTLRRHMKGTPAEGNVRAKTGGLRYANSLSGYVTSAAGERLAFSLMLNRNVTPPGRTSRDELDDLAVMLARFTGRSAPP